MRQLDWDDLLEVSDRPEHTDRHILVAGLPARVFPNRAAAFGFDVRASLPEDSDVAPWAMRTLADMVLLTALVEAGQVYAVNELDGDRDREWQRLLADDTRGCYVNACQRPVDPTAPVVDDLGMFHKACSWHLMGVLEEPMPEPPALVTGS